MILDAVNLPDDTPFLKQTIADLVKSSTEKEAEIKLLREQIRYLRDKLFGRKTEKNRDTGQLQLSLFDESAGEVPQAPETGEKIEVPSHTRRKNGRKPLPSDLPRIDVIHDLSDEEKKCACGCTKSRIGEEVSEQLDIVPARMQVIRNIRYKYVCKNCEGVEGDEPAVKIASMPEQIIPKSIATSGLLAHVLSAKFVDALPFYRQERQFARLGVDISRATMCGWAMKVAESCKPLLEILRAEILSGPVVNIDETTLKLLFEPGKTGNSKSYMWIFMGGPPGSRSLYYEYHPTRAGDVVAGFLKEYKGYVQTDGYSGYDFLDRLSWIRHLACWAHARRKFMEVIKATGKSNADRKKGIADEAIAFIRELYRIERDARLLNLSCEELRKTRQERALPVLNSFKAWLDNKSSQVPPKSLLGKAIGYTLKQWNRLVKYTEEGYLKPDNNDAENAIRPFVVGRKNWLFSGNPEGANASAAMFSLIETAKANGIEPYNYLRFLFEELPQARTTEDYKVLLPQYLDKDRLHPPA